MWLLLWFTLPRPREGRNDRHSSGGLLLLPQGSGRLGRREPEGACDTAPPQMWGGGGWQRPWLCGEELGHAAMGGPRHVCVQCARPAPGASGGSGELVTNDTPLGHCSWYLGSLGKSLSPGAPTEGAVGGSQVRAVDGEMTWAQRLGQRLPRPGRV